MATKLRSIQKNYGLWNKMDRNNVKVYAKIEVQINYGLWNRKDGNKVRVNAKIKGQKQARRNVFKTTGTLLQTVKKHRDIVPMSLWFRRA